MALRFDPSTFLQPPSYCGLGPIHPVAGANSTGYADEVPAAETNA